MARYINPRQNPYTMQNREIKTSSYVNKLA
jgi:hypothetical protein